MPSLASAPVVSFSTRLSRFFSALQDFFWPVKRHEYAKVIPLLLLKAFVSFNYGAMKCMKNALVINASKDSGSESTLLIKIMVLFVSIGFAMLYMKLSNHFAFGTLFYALLVGFILLFGLYAWVLFPQEKAMELHGVADGLDVFFKDWKFVNSKILSVPLRHWVPSTFFIMAELWGQIGIFVLYWGLVNRICTMQEAKRHYNIFIVGGTLAQMISTRFSVYYLNKYEALFGGGWLSKDEAYLRANQSLLYFMIGAAACMVLTYAWVEKRLLPGICSNAGRHAKTDCTYR